MKMKKLLVRCIPIYILSLAAGVAAGYFVKKKMSQAVVFEEITEEEQAKQMAEDEPKDAVEEIDRIFSGKPEEESTVQLDTQKVNYGKAPLMQKWKAEKAMEDYDTRTKEEPENAVIADDDLEKGIDHELLNRMKQEMETHPDIEPASIEDWDHWCSMQDQGAEDPEYDCVQILWFQDKVLTDENGDVIEKPGKYIGFDVPSVFGSIDEETTGDPDMRIVYNHPKGAIYQIIRKHCSYSRKRAMEEFGSEYDGEDEDDE